MAKTNEYDAEDKERRIGGPIAKARPRRGPPRRHDVSAFPLYFEGDDGGCRRDVTALVDLQRRSSTLPSHAARVTSWRYAKRRSSCALAKALPNKRPSAPRGSSY